MGTFFSERQDFMGVSVNRRLAVLHNFLGQHLGPWFNSFIQDDDAPIQDIMAMLFAITSIKRFCRLVEKYTSFYLIIKILAVKPYGRTEIMSVLTR